MFRRGRPDDEPVPESVPGTVPESAESVPGTVPEYGGSDILEKMFRLQGRLVDPSLNRVTSGGQTVQVEPKIMQVLVALVERPGEVVTREELMARVWPGVFVTDDVLHRAVRELRRLFDDGMEQPGIIETIRKRGYRLVAPIERVDRSLSPTHVAAGPRTATWNPRAVAVAGLLVAAILGGLAGMRFGLGRPASVDTEARVRFTPFTSEQGNEVDPALSASGRLAYVARAADGRAHLFSKLSPDARPVQITQGNDREYAPVWSPDETQLAFVQRSDRGCTVRIASADGGRARDLMPCASTEEFRMSWSPDGLSLAMTAGAATFASPAHIEIVTIADGQRRTLTQPPPAHIGDTSPAFSPDGRQIAFVRSISGGLGDVFVTPVDGGTPARVTSDNADVLGVDWEPDGRHLLFSSDRSGGISLWRVPVAGGEPAILAGGGAKVKHPSVARRTGSIAYEDWHYEINLMEGAAIGAMTPTPVSPTSDRWNFHPQVSPDGARLAFQSTRSGDYEIWIADRNGRDARQATSSRSYKSLPRWSADSRRLVFASRIGGQTEIVALDVDAGTARTISVEPTNASAPSWSHDGRHVYFGSPRGGDWQIWKVAVEDATATQVTSDGGYAALESLDGQWLYYTRLDRPGLLRRPASGGQAEMVAAHVRAENWPNWGVLDRGVFYLTWPDDGDPQLAIVDAPASPPRLLTRLPEWAWSGIAVTRDGARVIYAHADRRDANIGELLVAR
jgi:Tol biopolymer transport system component/DNA-binding winged helix-turn-helix (wHTH) protein